MQWKRGLPKLALGFVLAIAILGTAASAFAVGPPSGGFFAYNNGGQDVIILGFWAVGFAVPGVSTEFEIFADRTNTTRAMPIQIVFVDTDQKVIARKSDTLTAFHRKHYDAEQIITGSKATAGFFLVADSNQHESLLSGVVVIGLDPAGKVDGKANLILDSTGKAITTSTALTAHSTFRQTADQLEAPLGLTTCPDGTAGCSPGVGFQTFLIFLNAGTLTTVGKTTPLDQSQNVVVEFFGDDEVFLGDCDFNLTAFDVVIIRPGLDIALGPKLDACPVDLTPALVGTSKTTARYATSIRSVPDNKVLLGLVATVNTASTGGAQAYTYAMTLSADDTSTLHHRELTRLLLTT